MEATVEQRREKPLDVRNKVSKNMSTNPSQSVKSHLLRIPEAAEYLNSTVWFVRNLAQVRHGNLFFGYSRAF
jgi:hypothetical protein